MQQTDTPVMLNARHTTLEPIAIHHPGVAGLHAWPVKNQVGEATAWCEVSQCLHWIDVRAPAIHRLHPASGRFDSWQLPEVVGAMGLAEPNTVVLALKRSLAIVDLQLGQLVRLASVAAEPEHNRLNDGKVSPSGRWFVFGSMDDSANNKQTSYWHLVLCRPGKHCAPATQRLDGGQWHRFQPGWQHTLLFGQPRWPRVAGRLG